MQQFYKLIINDKKYGGYKKLASFLFLINAVVFFVLALRSKAGYSKLVLFTTAFLLLVYSLYNWNYKKKGEKSYAAVYLLAAVIWITDTPYWYFAVVFIIMPFLQYRMESRFFISLSERCVTVNGFIKTDYAWKDFNNIILKDNWLTLDFNNNRIIQVQPDWNESSTNSAAQDHESRKDYHLLEKEFNEFCNRQLNK